VNALEVAQRSIDAWNSHDADALVALYAEGGTYSAPRAGKEALTGKAIADFAKAVWRAYRLIDAPSQRRNIAGSRACPEKGLSRAPREGLFTLVDLENPRGVIFASG
jgi:hypothetical protein